MPATPWDSASPLYRRVVVTAMVFLGLGIISAIVLVPMHIKGLWWVTVALLGLGILCHIFGLAVRIRDARGRMKAARARGAAKVKKSVKNNGKNNLKNGQPSNRGNR